MRESRGLAVDPSGPGLPARSARARQIVTAARDILEAEGPEGLTMRRIGTELGIRAPSLYKHFPGKDGVRAALVAEALLEVGTALHAAVARGGEADRVARLLVAYRAFATDHPHLYRLCTAGELDREALPEGLEEWAGTPFFLVTGEPYRAQALWAAAHGLAVLEIDHRFLPGSDLDRTWEAAAGFG